MPLISTSAVIRRSPRRAAASLCLVAAVALALTPVSGARAAGFSAGGVFVSPDGHAWHDTGLDGSSISAVTIAANSPELIIIAGADGGQLGGGYAFQSTGGGAWQPLASGLPSGAVVSDLSSGPIDA